LLVFDAVLERRKTVLPLEGVHKATDVFYANNERNLFYAEEGGSEQEFGMPRAQFSQVLHGRPTSFLLKKLLQASG
jgi:hypothetical protein